MIASVRDNDELLLNAYCDGELDPASAIEFERRLAENESLKSQYNRLLSLQRAVRSLPQYEMPAGPYPVDIGCGSSGPGGTSRSGGTCGSGETSASAKLVVSGAGGGGGVWRGDLKFCHDDDRALRST